MRQAIVTRYLGPTDHRGSRVKATCQAGSVTLSWDNALDPDANHDKAANALATKLGWITPSFRLVGGGMPDSRGNCYVIVPTEDKVREALRVLLNYAKGNGSSREGNPYCKPEVQNAIVALGEDT